MEEIIKIKHSFYASEHEENWHYDFEIVTDDRVMIGEEPCVYSKRYLFTKDFRSMAGKNAMSILEEETAVKVFREYYRKELAISPNKS